jgi:hypothetical protein
MAVPPRPTPETTTAFFVQRHRELVYCYASSQAAVRLLAPVIEEAVTPAERSVLVDADHDAAATDREPAFNAPEEDPPALRALQVVERRAREGAERSATVPTAEALPSGEATPLLYESAVAVGTACAIAEPSAVFHAERESEVGDRRVEGRFSGHDRKGSAGSGAEE